MKTYTKEEYDTMQKLYKHKLNKIKRLIKYNFEDIYQELCSFYRYAPETKRYKEMMKIIDKLDKFNVEMRYILK